VLSRIAAFTLALALPSIAFAQRQVAPRFRAAAAMVVIEAPGAGTRGALVRPVETGPGERVPAPVGSQLIGGLVGFAVGTALALVIVDEDGDDLLLTIIGVGAGAAIGTTAGVHVVGAHYGVRAPVAPTLLAATLGLAGGVRFAPALSPLLATGAFNLFRRSR